ncbi:MAG: amidohydrolase family protein [Schleiferiaceae bacterium]|nr:amidohydrolase family protein [Schleiferiaceae bacterium]MDG1881566.1 amidohydrolase family protein [Schleiferiaceae bacterium]
MKPLVVDIHTHILPKNIPSFAKQFGYGGFIKLDHNCKGCARMLKNDVFFREVQENCWDPEVRLNESKQFGVDIQVLSTVPVMFSYWAKSEDALVVSKFLNDHLAEIVERYPKKFEGLGTLPMQDPDLAILELQRCKKIGLKGVQIGSHVNEWNLDAPELFPIFQECERLNMAVFIHPWDMMGANTMSKYWLPWLVGMPAESSRAICSMIFGGVFERLPLLRVAVAHGGGSFTSTIGRIEHGFNVRPDLCAIDNQFSPSSYLGKFWIDSLVHDQNMLNHIINMVGDDKVLMGSDYPFPLGELTPGELIKSMDWSANKKEKVLGSNALNWLNGV